MVGEKRRGAAIKREAGASGHAVSSVPLWAQMRSWAHSRGSAVTPTAPAVRGQLWRRHHLLRKGLQAGDALFRRRVGAKEVDKPIS